MLSSISASQESSVAARRECSSRRCSASWLGLREGMRDGDRLRVSWLGARDGMRDCMRDGRGERLSVSWLGVREPP